MRFESQNSTSFETISEKDEALQSLIERCAFYNLEFDREQLAKLTILPTESLQGILLELSALNSNIKEISMWKKTLYTRIFNGNP